MRGLKDATLPAHPKKHHHRKTGKTKHNQVISKAAIFNDRPKCRAVYLCVTSESSRAGIARSLWSASPGHGNVFTIAKLVDGQMNASIPQDGHARARHCRRRLRLTLGGVPRGAAGRCGGCLECAILPGCRRLPDPVTRRHSYMRLSVLFPICSMLRQARSLRRARRLRTPPRCV